jgi:hypothetical protein
MTTPDKCPNCAELDALFELQQTRVAAATKAWQDAHPDRADVFPDLGELVNWLMVRAGLAPIPRP